MTEQFIYSQKNNARSNPPFKKLIPDIGAYELNVIARNCMPSFQGIKLANILPIFKNMQVAIVGDKGLHEIKTITDNAIKLKYPCRYLCIGFPYKSSMQTFPLIFPDEIEHMPKFDYEIELKLYNTKGGYIEEQLDNGSVERQHINSPHIDSDNLLRFAIEKKYLATNVTKEFCNIFATPYTSGWVYFTTRGAVSPDTVGTFVVYKPVPEAVLKIYAKAKILAGYRGL